MEPLTGEETGPVTAGRKLEDQIHQSTTDFYENLLKQEQEAAEAKRREETTLQFDTVRKLGFATAKDVDEKLQGIVKSIATELENIKQENLKMREFIVRMRAQGAGLPQGMNSGALDQPGPEVGESILDKYSNKWLRPRPKTI